MEKHNPKGIADGVSLFPVSKRTTPSMPKAFWKWLSDRQNALDLNDAGVARQALAGQIAEAQADLAGLEAQLERAASGGPAPDPEQLLSGARRLQADDVWHLPPDELRAIIARSLPALYVLDGQLVPAPKEN